MLKGMKVFCVHLEGTYLLDGVAYQIKKYMVEDGNILIQVLGDEDFYYMNRFEKVDDVIDVSIERGIDIKEAIRCFI